MKSLFFVCFICAIRICIAQDTLYMPVPGLGAEKFILKNDGTYIYHSRLCGSRFVSAGTYRKTLTGYRFHCDTTKCPVSSIVQETATDKDSICVFFYDFTDSIRISFWGNVFIAGKTYNCENDSLQISKKDLPDGPTSLRLEEGQEFFVDKSYTTVKLFLAPPGYRCGDNHIRKLRKTRRGYMDKDVVYDEDAEAPWKKHRRVVRHYFKN